MQFEVNPINQTWENGSKPRFRILAEKWLSLDSEHPVVGQKNWKCSKIVFKWLTFRIEPFGAFEKKFWYLPDFRVDLPGHAQYPKMLNISRTNTWILMKFSPMIALNVFFLNLVSIWPEKIRFNFENFFSLKKCTKLLIKKNWDFSRKIRLCNYLQFIVL